MTRHGWLEETLQEAEDKNWCVQVSCTTCRAVEFKSAFIRRGVKHAGVELSEDWRFPSAFEIRSVGVLGGARSSSGTEILDDKIEEIFSALIDALREVGPKWRGTDALRLILCELVSFIRWGHGNEPLGRLLAGTPAGDECLAMRAHDRRRYEAHYSQRAYEAAAPERRTQKKLEAQIEHAARLKESAKRKGSREELLNQFAALSGVERLVFLAEQSDDFPFGMISAELIPTADYASELSQDQRSRLVEIIDRRKGRWAKLRTGLGQISAE
jgi:hypothetical protein